MANFYFLETLKSVLGGSISHYYRQSFFNFLWLENHDMEKEPQDYVICAHAFGATSSASCLNYVLNKTTLGIRSFAEVAASTLNHSFYADDLLKFVGDGINTQKAGGFRLAKFISNNKQQLWSVPEQERRLGGKNQEFPGDLPNKEALGICWNLKEDNIFLKLKLQARNLNKRITLSMIGSIYNLFEFAAPFIIEQRRI